MQHGTSYHTVNSSVAHFIENVPSPPSLENVHIISKADISKQNQKKQVLVAEPGLLRKASFSSGRVETSKENAPFISWQHRGPKAQLRQSQHLPQTHPSCQEQLINSP